LADVRREKKISPDQAQPAECGCSGTYRDSPMSVCRELDSHPEYTDALQGAENVWRNRQHSWARLTFQGAAQLG
jgi:hypothetical protein